MLHRAACFAMGTRFELLLEGRDAPHACAAAEAALEEVAACDARFSRFRTDSLVSRIDREAARAWVRVDPRTFELLERCARWTRDTQGAFDVCVGRGMDRVRAGAHAAVEAGALELDRATSSVRFARPDTALDLGGVAKGFALDLAAEVLREVGVTRALLHGGTSSVLALGAPPGEPEGWRVDLGPEFEHRTATLRDRALSLSAARGSRASDAAAVRGTHVLDPRDGRLLEDDTRAAVCAQDAAEAEAWSTALLVLAARTARSAAVLDGLSLPEELECALVGPGSTRFERSSASLRSTTPPVAHATSHAR